MSAQESQSGSIQPKGTQEAELIREALTRKSRKDSVPLYLHPKRAKTKPAYQEISTNLNKSLLKNQKERDDPSFRDLPSTSAICYNHGEQAIS